VYNEGLYHDYFSASIDSSDKKLNVESSGIRREVYLKKSDNIRMLDIFPVTKAIDSNIKPENIKKGATILGVTGTYHTKR
jgi:hypothetical protein